MGKLIFTDNGITTVRNFSHLVVGLPNGKLLPPKPFRGSVHLSTGATNRHLVVLEPSSPRWSNVRRDPDYWSKVWISILFIVFGMALHRALPVLLTLIFRILY